MSRVGNRQRGPGKTPPPQERISPNELPESLEAIFAQMGNAAGFWFLLSIVCTESDAKTRWAQMAEFLLILALRANRNDMLRHFITITVKLWFYPA